ncbi:hypothetical protein, variant [Puccinia triticina 1-1 BBBD Race 1]|uniref:Uncharacterized protein n=1 Tax=Puccinia triticina (isolate 1-1 / race 1 (BBBD)) TaxID=630390 RepID=A0A180GL23_PUCT1|nr:hypothetical protein PTTG_12589 [Puccinia triticina 1-1 BBBD Race 1]OAV93252.1 hypothetical protein, variant [Puccinia triticina 1-1 BBBD Race 1]
MSRYHPYKNSYRQASAPSLAQIHPEDCEHLHPTLLGPRGHAPTQEPFQPPTHPSKLKNPSLPPPPIDPLIPSPKQQQKKHERKSSQHTKPPSYQCL